MHNTYLLQEAKMFIIGYVIMATLKCRGNYNFALPIHIVAIVSQGSGNSQFCLKMADAWLIFNSRSVWR